VTRESIADATRIKLTLKGIGTLSLLPNDIQDGIDEFGTFRVVYTYVSEKNVFEKRHATRMLYPLTSFCPVVTRTALAEHEVVWAEKATDGTRPNSVHGSRLEIDQDRARNIFVGTNFIIVNRDALELKVIIALVKAIMCDPMFIRNDLPELDT
jgi:hypothetical protein